MAITKNLVNIGNADISGDLTAATLKKRNGTNKQILLADGTTKDMGTSTTTFLRNDGTWATVSSGTDEKVKVSTSETDAKFPIMAIATSSVTSGNTYQAIYDAGIVINPAKHSVAEGLTTTASGQASHAEGYRTSVTAAYAHVEGYGSKAAQNESHAEGNWTEALGIASHAEGDQSKTVGSSAHAEGAHTNAIGDNTHAEGRGLIISLGTVTAVGSTTQYTLSSISVTIEGSTYTLQVYDIVNYNSNYAKVTAISGNTITINQTLSAAVGDTISLIKGVSYGARAHSEGYLTSAINNQDHAEGYLSIALGGCSHAEGERTRTETWGSHAEGRFTIASGQASHAEGLSTTASGTASHASGIGTIADKEAMTAIGKYNTSTQPNIGGNYLFVVGNGTASATASRSNAFAVTTNGATANRIQIAGGPYQNLSGNPDNGGLYFGDGYNCYIKEWISTEGFDTDSMLLHVDNSNNGFHFELSDEMIHLYEYNDSIILNHERNNYDSFIISSNPTHAQLELNGEYWAKLSADGGDAYITVDGDGNELGNDGGIRLDTTGCGGNITMDTGSGDVSINTGTGIVKVSNKVNAVSGFFQTSDKRQKNIISDLSLEKVYDLIDKCQTIIYTLKDDESNKKQIGMIAQEIQEFFPEVISEDKDGMLSLDYSRLTVIIFKVLKDLIKRIEKLEQKLN